VRIFQLN